MSDQPNALYAFYYKRSKDRGGSVDYAIHEDKDLVTHWHERRAQDANRYEWVGDVTEYRKVSDAK